MSKLKHAPNIIPLNEYNEELEALVKQHVTRIETQCPPFRVNKKYTHVVYPEKFADAREQREWEMEELRRCRDGFDGLPGKYYYYFNHCKIESKTGGFIRPDFRAIDLSWFKTVEECKGTGFGIVCIKRRQCGMSWKAAADVLHEASFNIGLHIGMNSKSKDDSEMMFDNIRLIHQELPPFLTPATSAINNRERIVFAKKLTDVNGNPVHIGTRSSIRCVAPTVAAHAGKRYGLLVIDEAGEQSELLPMWAKSEPCITQDTHRVGGIYVFGTVGNVTDAGAGLKHMWINHKSYDFKQFAFWGYHALITDELGNDCVEDSVRYIIYTRKRIEGRSQRERNEFFQMFPLDENDAFLNVSNTGVGDQLLISQQITHLTKNPPSVRTGYMRRNPNGEVDFVPDTNGKMIVYDLPQSLVNGYVAAADPADHDDVNKSRDSSNLALMIVAKPYGIAPPKLVLEYVDRPKKLDQFFEQCAMALQWYNNTKVLTEDNRNRMRKYFEDNNYLHLLSYTPRDSKHAAGGFEKTLGVKMNEARKQQMMGLIADYVDHYVSDIPSIRLLQEFQVFGGEHSDDDAAIAFGWALVLLQADKRAAQNSDELSKNTPHLPFKRVGGVIQLVNTQGQPIRRLTLPKNPLFNR